MFLNCRVKKLPPVFVFCAGIALGIGLLWLLQFAGTVKRKPECENLQLQVEALELRVNTLRLRLRDQDEQLQQFRNILGQVPDSLPK